MDDIHEKLQECLKTVSQEPFELYLTKSVPEIENAPESPLTFYRDWIGQNRPVIIRNGIKHWDALEKWKNNEYLIQKCDPDKIVKVAVTPNGYADAITDGKFVMPYEESMTFKDFIDIIENPEKKQNAIHYIQRQNSNLTDEMFELLQDIEELQWAKEAFGKNPDAINFWMGDGRAVTSTHKDPYENIYCVVKGYKDIILFPPTDLPWLPYKLCDQAIYQKSQNGFVIETLEDSPKLPWIAVDPLNPDLKEFPGYKNAHPMKLRLNAGDVLYLPSLWFHHLQQSHGCIAVNFWYDMEFDSKFNYFNFVKDVTNVINGTAKT